MNRKWFSLILAGTLLLLPGCKADETTSATAAGEPPTKAAVQSTTTPATTAAEISVDDLPVPKFDPATWQQHTKPVTMTFHSESTLPSGNFPDHPLWGEDPISRHIQNITGVKLVELQAEKMITLEAIMASGEWADFYHTAALDFNSPLDNSTLSYSLDELAAQYCPDFWDGMDALEILNNTASDGHIYTLRSNYNNTDIYSDEDIPLYPQYSTVINTKWLEAIGADMPTSIEELEECLYQVKDLNKSIIPFNMGDALTSPIASWMGIMEDNYWDQENKTVRTPLLQEGWAEYLKIMNRWYREDLLALPTIESKPSYDDYDTEYDSHANFSRWSDMHSYLEGRSALSFATSFQSTLLEEGISIRKGADQEEVKWQVITQPLTWQGENRRIAQDNTASRSIKFGQSVNGGSGLFITRTCSNPERAIYFYQFLKTDNASRLIHWGIEGIHYTMDGNKVPSYTEKFRIADDQTSHTAYLVNHFGEDGLNYWTFVPNAKVSALFNTQPAAHQSNWDVIHLRTQLKEAGLTYKDEAWENKCPVLQFADPAAGSQDDQTYNAIFHYWRSAMEDIITQAIDPADVDMRWRALKDELHLRGIAEIEQAMTIRFTEALERYHQAGYYTDIQP